MKGLFVRPLVLGLLVFLGVSNGYAATHKAAQTAYACAMALLPHDSGPIPTEEKILEMAAMSESPSIIAFGRQLQTSLITLEAFTPEHSVERYRWDLGQKLIELHELLEHRRAGVPETEIAEVSEALIQEIRASVKKYSVAQPVVSLSVKKQVELPGAEYIGLEEVTRPQLDVFAAPSASAFKRWLGRLGGEERKAIHKRLIAISLSQHFGDSKAVHSDSKTTVSELRFHLGSGPRVYFIEYKNAFVIVGFSEKSDGPASQNRSIQQAGGVADLFMSLQK